MWSQYGQIERNLRVGRLISTSIRRRSVVQSARTICSVRFETRSGFRTPVWAFSSSRASWEPQLRQYCTYKGGFTSVSPTKMKLDSPEFHALFTPELRTLQGLFEKHGYEIRICGGAVRDLLMGKVPADIDFATTATPDEMKELFEKEEIRVINIKGSERHGTVTCRINDKENFEVTTLRIDIACDGRRAEVEWTRDWFLDSERRDLTINSMFLALDGTVHDYFNGIEDIKKKRVAFVNDARKRIQEDYLRILRYFRFYGRISEVGDKHEADAIAAIKENAAGMKGISGERIWSELKKILVGNHAAPIVKTMIEECDLAPYIGFPESPKSDRMVEVWNRMKALDITWKPPTLLAALVDTIPEVEALNKRIKYSKMERVLTEFIVNHRESSVGKPGKHFQDLYLDEGGGKMTENRERVCELLKYLGEPEKLAHMQTWVAPNFPVGGIQIIEQGVKKGPPVKIVMGYLYKLWKESNYEATAQELLTHCHDVEIPAVPPKRHKSRERSAESAKSSA